MAQDKRKFQILTDEVMNNRSKKGACRSKLIRLGQYDLSAASRSRERVLFITYRQTLARDIVRNFGKLGCTCDLDSYDDPSVWNVPCLTVQPDSLMNIFEMRDGCGLRHDMIRLDES